MCPIFSREALEHLFRLYLNATTWVGNRTSCIVLSRRTPLPLSQRGLVDSFYTHKLDEMVTLSRAERYNGVIATKRGRFSTWLPTSTAVCEAK